MKRYPLGNYGLSKVLFALFLFSWLGQLVAQYYEVVNQAAEHGQPAPSFWSGDFWWAFAQATFENWQSEFLQLLTFVTLTAYLIHRGSHESRDSDDEFKEQLDRIEAKLDGK